MSLPVRKLLVAGVPLLLTACATIGPPEPPSLDLPKPPSDLRAKRKGEHVVLSWTIPTVTTDRQTVRSLGPTRICRGAEAMTQCGTSAGIIPRTRAGTPPAKNAAGSYSDTLPDSLLSNDPSAVAAYAVEVLNREGRSAGLSNLVPVSLTRTLPPPTDFAAQVTAQGVVLAWTGEAVPSQAPSRASVQYVYRVFRRTKGNPGQTLAGEVPAGDERHLTLTDSNIEWETTYDYHVEAVTVIANADRLAVQVEGDDSPEAEVFAHDVFPPAVPSALQAVFSGPGQQRFVDLIWAPVSDVDLDGYNVYRREEGTAWVRVNAQIVKTPAYRDTTVVSGKKYFYSVSAVDVRGNESARSEEASESVP